MQKRILILGGTGMVGQIAARHLQKAGFQVRVMTRDGQKAGKLFDGSCEVFVGNPQDAACLEEALPGCYGVHISLPTEAEQQATEMVAKLASKHGIERITYISGATVAEENRWFPMVNRKFLAEKAIREMGVPYTFFCPTWVMESLPLFVRQGRASILGKQPYPYHWVAGDDLARMVSRAYQLEEAENKRFVVHGPEAIPMQEALRRYCAVFHPDIQSVSSMPFWLVRLLAAITGDEGLKDAGKLMGYFEKVGEGNGFPERIDSIGIPRMTLGEWLEQRKTSFNIMSA
jgi:uncharacterized protein YbjT (DUF2867 family)